MHSYVSSRHCRECRSTYNALYYAHNRQRCIDQANKWQRNNVEKRRLTVRRVNLRKIGCSPEEYDRLFVEQGGCCAVCRTSDPGRGDTRRKYFSVDHDHDSQEIRGLLCFACNAAIGLLGDNLLGIRKVVEYLERRK